jgi:hypothetical protein
MPNDTSVGEGLHLVKPGWTSGQSAVRVTIPKDAAVEAGILPGDGLVAVRRIGACIVLTRSRFAAGEDARREADENLEAAFTEWNAHRTHGTSNDGKELIVE